MSPVPPDVLSSEPHPGRRRVVGGALLLGVAALVVTDVVRDARERERTAEAASVRLLVTSAQPTGAGRPGRPLQDVQVDLSVRNEGPSVVRVLEQRLDGGVPVDPGPATTVAAGATAVLAVRWRVRCAEVGSLFGPESLDLVVRTRSGEVRRTELAIGPLRRTFRLAASDACAAR